MEIGFPLRPVATLVTSVVEFHTERAVEAPFMMEYPEDGPAGVLSFILRKLCTDDANV
jgi:hypothetical protein